MYFKAWSKDREVRRYSSSGGFTKEILRAALETGYVDYLVFPRMKGTRPEVVATKKSTDLFTPLANSVYQPISSLKGLKDVPPNKTCAMTLLPCHLDRGRDPRIKLVVELLCDYTPKYSWTEKVLASLGLDEDDVLEFGYRGGIWPGNAWAVAKDGRCPVVRFPQLWDSDPTIDAPIGCQKCGREENRGDIIVGDPWKLEKPYEGLGKTMVRVVSPEMMSLVEAANIETEPISKQDWDRSVKYHRAQKAKRRPRIAAHLWRCHDRSFNFGEALGDMVLKGIGVEPVYGKRSGPRPGGRVLLSVGSELRQRFINKQKERYDGVVVWGHGYSYQRPADPATADIRAVRGPLTRKVCGLPGDTPLGDPAFLMPKYYPLVRENSGEIVYAPHWFNRATDPGDYGFFDVNCEEGEAQQKMQRLVSADFVMTNSLHVAIFCIAYSVPFGPTLLGEDGINKPWKWADIFEWLKCPLCWNYNEKQARRWYEAFGSKIEVPDLDPLVDSFPWDITE